VRIEEEDFWAAAAAHNTSKIDNVANVVATATREPIRGGWRRFQSWIALNCMRDPKHLPQHYPPGIDAWLPWHPSEAMKWLTSVPGVWCVAGGWALDLWLGKQTRAHHDLEIAVLRPDFAAFRARLHQFRCFVTADGESRRWLLAFGLSLGSTKYGFSMSQQKFGGWLSCWSRATTRPGFFGATKCFVVHVRR
jgi:hypothetical protein